RGRRAAPTIHGQAGRLANCDRALSQCARFSASIGRTMAFTPEQVQAWIAPALVAFALGVLAAWFVLRGRRRDAQALGRASRDAELAQVATERDASAEALQRLHRDHDATLRELAEHRTRIVALSRDGATLAGRLERLTQVEAELVAARAEARH